ALASAASFACGFLSIALGTLLMALALVTTGKHFSEIAVSIIIAHLPLMAIEGILTLFLVGFLRKVKPEMMEISYAEKT
ncbi:MAG: hypothetical protein GY868_13320, partial [Deltaproteobacteria bacterium]|nr:hypothetical protein [Deltaproteobacteria bacterium]